MRRWVKACTMNIRNGAAPKPCKAGSKTCRMQRIPGTCMRSRKTFWPVLTALASVVAGVLGVGTATRADDDIAVTVINASEPTLCAETDNVYVKLVSPSVRRFSVEASHPAYGRTIVVDHSAPDFH